MGAPQGAGKGSALPQGLQDRIDAIETNQRDTDAQAFQKAVERRARVSFSVAIAGFGTVLYLLSAYLISTSGIGDAELTKLFHEQSDPNAYAWPMVAFGTAFGLNFITLLFERESAKFQLAFLACYINFLAGFSDYMSFKGYAPIVRDGWGQGFQLLRTVMWLLTTPAMVYLLSIISDFSRAKVYAVMLADVLMISFGILAFLVSNRWGSVALYLVAVGFFAFVVYSMWTMFNASIAEARHDSSRFSLEVLRLFTVGLWFTFPCVWLIVKLGFLDVRSEEWVWCVSDFLGKVLFSSSLLHGNFLTIEQRRLIAMRIVEEGNRIQVIHELKDLVEQKERFMSSMSHELRTPLNGIIGLSDALLVGSCGDVNEQALKTITTIKTSGARLLNLINDILDAASMRKGKLTIKHERVALRRVVDDVIDLCQPLAKRGVKLVNDLREGIPPVLGDTGRIIQIFHNLIGNSCKFTHTGHISVSASVQGDEVEVGVSDSGIGIPEEKFDQIFMAFEQVDMSITRKYGGTGLGLSLVKQLVEAHGGRIGVRSKENAGTTFFFTLKVHSEHPNGGQPQGAPTEAVAAAPEHSQLAAVRSAGSGVGGGGGGGHAGPRRAPSRRGSFNDKMLGALGAKKAAGEAAPRSGLAPQGGQGGGVSGEEARESSSSLRLQMQALQESVAGGEGGSPASGSFVGVPGSSGAEDGKERSGAANPRSVAAGPQVSGPMSLNDAAALMKGALVKRHASFRDKAAAGASSGNSGPEGGRVRVRVLSVDDDPVNQLVIQNLLAPVGYEILQAMDGQEALRVLAEEEVLPDVILLDVMMPGMSGYEVCRKLREMYPLSCIPVIMISAKSKEEHIVEGLAAGSNDYVVKPFGRQEILARIAAHLRFRDTVYQAGEIAGAIPPMCGEGGGPGGLAGRVLLRGGGGGPLDLAPFLTSPPAFASLPPRIARGVEASTTGSTLQMFEQLTLLEVRLPNLTDLLPRAPASDLLLLLSGLFTELDGLLEAHGAFLCEGLDDSFTLVSGLGEGQGPADQVPAALRLARGLLAAAEGVTGLGGRRLALALSIGVHTGPAQGVLVGHSHPCLHFTGQLPAEVHMLAATCPPNCVHVSAKVLDALAPPERSQFVAAGHMQYCPTYLLRAGGWDAGGIVAASEATTAWARGRVGTHGGINTQARRMRPVQLALLALSQANPGFLVDIAGCAEPPPRPALEQAPPGAAAADANGGAPSDAAAAAATTAELAALRRDYEALERQMEEVSAEAARLQDLVDALEEQLQASEGAAEAASQSAEEAEAAAAGLKAQVAELEGQLEEAARERGGLEAALAEMEQRLVATHAALASANHEAADRARARTPGPGPGSRPSAAGGAGPAEPRVESGSVASGSEAGFGFGALAYGPGALAARGPLPLGLAMRGLPSVGTVRAAAAGASDMRALLEELGLGPLAARFEAEEVTPGLLPYLDEGAMRELGAGSVGARLRLRLAAQALLAAGAGGGLG